MKKKYRRNPYYPLICCKCIICYLKRQHKNNRCIFRSPGKARDFEKRHVTLKMVHCYQFILSQHKQIAQMVAKYKLRKTVFHFYFISKAVLYKIKRSKRCLWPLLHAMVPSTDPFSGDVSQSIEPQTTHPCREM